MSKINAHTIHKTRSVVGNISVSLVILLMVCLAIISPAQAEAKQVGADFSLVDSYIESQMKDLHIPGIALAIVQGDQIAYLHGYGEAGPGKGLVTPQTPFMIGSVTKSFTALAVMQLVDAGQVELDAPVQTYLPWFRVADPQASAQITVRHLLNQNSGFSRASGLEEEMASDLSDEAIESGVRRLGDDVLSSAPGTMYAYSNVNFNILGLIVQTLSGQSYESYIQEHIFDPLEMRHSFTSQAQALQAGMAKGHLMWFGIPFAKDVPFNRGGLPNGFLISSAEDMAHFLIAQLNQGHYGNRSVLSPEGIQAMHQPAVPTGTSGEYYGMAWDIGENDGKPVVYHSGDNANFSSYVIMQPEEELGVVLLENANGLFVNNSHSQLAKGVLAVMAGKQPQPYAAPIEAFVEPVGSLVVPVVLSVLWIAWMAYRFIRRRKRGIPSQPSVWWYVWVIVLPFVVDIGLLLVLLVGIPMLWGTPLNVMATFFSDLFTLLILSAIALGAWGLVRPLLTLKQAQSQPLASR